MKNTLCSLIKPKTKDEFLNLYRKNTPFVCHKLDDSTRDLTELPFLQSLEDLLAFWPKTVDCYLPGIADEINSFSTTTEHARELYHDGSGLIFNDADIESSVLRFWVESILSELGLSALTYGRCLIYAIPAGKKTDPHFDQNINFVYQVKGEKKWWIAPNEHVQNPLTRHTIGTPMDPELESYTKSMPEEFPTKATEYTLKPGSLLFVPRGFWHKTMASNEDTLSISFTFTAPTWIDILTTAMRGRLAQSSYWRETANFVTDKENFEEAADRFDSLLSELALEVPHWRARNILRATEMDRYPVED